MIGKTRRSRIVSVWKKEVVRDWEQEVARLEAAFAPLAASLMRVQERDRSRAWGAMLDWHLDTRLHLRNAREWLAAARRGRPVLSVALYWANRTRGEAR
jgi:hypothetical protein